MAETEKKSARVVVVTGAARGMGRTFALRLARDGFAIAALDVLQDKLEETRQLIKAEGGAARAYCVDLSVTSEIEPLFRKIEKELGLIQVLVNNAAILQTQPLLEVTERDWDSIMAVNAKAAFFCLQAAGRRMVQRKTGSIINIASVAGRSSRPKHAIYGASKALVMHLTKSAAAAFGPFGVRVNAICPGVIETPMWQQVKTERTPEEVANILRSIALARPGDPAEVAEVVAFLASDRSSYITGQSWNVCGGLEMD